MGQILRVDGEQELRVEGFGRSLAHRVIIATVDVRADGVLGLDVLRQLGVYIDLTRGALVRCREGRPAGVRMAVESGSSMEPASVPGRAEDPELGKTRGNPGDPSMEEPRGLVQGRPLAEVEAAKKRERDRCYIADMVAAARRIEARIAGTRSIEAPRRQRGLEMRAGMEEARARRETKGRVPVAEPRVRRKKNHLRASEKGLDKQRAGLNCQEAVRPCEIRVGRNETLPAHSESIVWCPVEGLGPGAELLLEPEGLPWEGIRVARCVARVIEGKVPVQVINLTGGDQKLDNRTMVARGEVLRKVGTHRYSRSVRVTGVAPGTRAELTREDWQEKLGHLGGQDRRGLQDVLENFADVFAEPSGEGCRLPVSHKIDTGSARPIAKRPYRVPYHERPVVEECLQDMLRKGVIAPSDSPWSAPVVLVKKRDPEGQLKYRFCTDFRGLNAVTRVDPYPLPLIQETLDQLGASKYFTTLDLTSGYHQVPVAPEDQEKTAFTTEGGHFEYKKMAFGLAGAPATFQRLMDRLLGRLKGKGALVYLDDVIIYSETLEEHLERLAEVLELLRQANLKVNWKKCRFAEKEVTYLGHVISADGVRPNPELVRAVKDYPTPTSQKEVRAFLGLAGYYRRFVPQFAERARPLTQLTGKRGFIWGPEEQAAFVDLREALCSDQVLVYPDFRDTFTLATDASGVALGAVLSQVREGRERPIAYASRQLRGPELNYSATEKELLAVVWATKLFRCYLLGRTFRLVTDHAALRWMLSLRDPSSRLTRWALRLQEFDYQVEHKPGKRHTNADALSRHTVAVAQSEGATRKALLGAQIRDPWCEKLQMDHTGMYRTDSGGLLYRTEKKTQPQEWKVVVPESMRSAVIEANHSSRWAGHPGIERTAALVKQSYYWPGLGRDVERLVKACRICAQRKTPAGLNVPVEPPFVAREPFEQISLDIVGPYPKSPRGNRYLLTVIDNLTRYAEAIPLREQSAEETARAFVENVVTRHGAPARLVTDQGRNFVSRLFREVCHLLGIRKLQTTAYHPQSNGMVERLHRTLTETMAHFARRDGKDWDLWVPYALMAYRAIPHTSTGYSPNYLIYGRELEGPLGSVRPLEGGSCEAARDMATRLREAHELAYQRAEAAWKERNRYCNRGRRSRQFAVGDLVYLKVPAIKPGHFPKFHRPWTGPHKVMEVISKVTYRLQLSHGGTTVVHINRLKPAFEEAQVGKRPTMGSGDRVISEPPVGVESRKSGPVGPLVDWEEDEDSDEEDGGMGGMVGTAIDDEDSEETTEAHLRGRCPVQLGESAECSREGCPLGGSFGERGSGAEVADESTLGPLDLYWSPGEDSGSEGDEPTAMPRESESRRTASPGEGSESAGIRGEDEARPGARVEEGVAEQGEVSGADSAMSSPASRRDPEYVPPRWHKGRVPSQEERRYNLRERTRPLSD